MTEVISAGQAFDSKSVEIRNPGFSNKLWDLCWQKHFPLELESHGEKIVSCDFDTVNKFYKENSKEIFRDTDSSGNFLTGEDASSTLSKFRYYQEMGDFFAFKQGAQVVGVFVGTPIDWSSYYIRSISLLPSFQKGNRYQTFLRHLLEILRNAGVQRVELDTSPSNLPMIHVHNKFQFNITGVILSERWGSLLHLTKYLSSKHEAAFLNQFCYGAKPQLLDSKIHGKENTK